MKILYLHQYFVPPGGSGGTRSYEMARRLVKKGHQVTLITSSAKFPPSYQLEKLVNYLQLEGVSLVVLNVPYSNKFSYGKRIIAFFKYVIYAIRVILSIQKPDVIFATSTPLTIALPAVLAKIKYRAPMVFEVRDLWPEVPIKVGAIKNPVVIFFAKWLEKFAYRNSSRIVALSPGMKEGIKKTGYPEDKIPIIPNSSDIELFNVPAERGVLFRRKYPFLEDKPLIVYAGTMGYINGISYMVEMAFEMSKINPDIRFFVVGTGKEEEQIQNYAKRLGVWEKNFWIAPPIPKLELPDLLSAATLTSSFVINNEAVWENSANKFFDAFAAGKPILLNYGGWQAEIINKWGAGVVVAPTNAKEAAVDLNRFVSDQSRLALAGQAARKLAVEYFDRNKLVLEFERVLLDAYQSSQK